MNYYNRFYRHYGIRRISQLTNPVVNDASDLLLPRGSIFHYLPENSVVKGIPSDHWAVKDSERLAMTDHVEKLADSATLGRPRRTSIQPGTEIRDYHRRHRRIKQVRNIDRDIRDDRTPLIVNYALLPSLYRYTQSVYSHYYEYQNILTTLWVGLETYTELERHQFLSFDLEPPLPDLSTLKRADKDLSRQLIDSFNTLDRLIVLDLWRWLGEHREKSELANLSKKAISQTNIIIRYCDKWVMVNLGVLDQWRQGIEDSKGSIDPDALQKRFLRILMTLFETATPAATRNGNQADSQTGDAGKEKNAPHAEDDKEDTPDDIHEALSNKENDEELNQELDNLNQAAQQQDDVVEDNPFTNPIEEPDRSQGVIERARALANEGLISGAEFNRYQKLGEAYKNITNPYTGQGTIDQNLTVTPEEVEIKEPTKLADNPAIIDKSMLDTTLAKFDRRYVENVLPKDVMGSVLNFNKAGVAVTDYNIEKVEDVANAYEMHTVKLNPVQGKPSTLRFKIPTIKADGTWESNGTRYRMRKQRADLPIRKIRPNKVALTSYYGKVFVERSTKVVHDYGRWLTKQIRTIGLDNNDDRVTNLKSAKSIGDEVHVPRLYSILAGKFLSFTAGGIDFNLNYEDREKIYGEDLVKALEKQDMLPVGTKNGVAVAVDQNDTLYLVKTDDVEVLGAIEDIIGLERTKAPVDVAEIKIFSKSAPLGIVLGYYMGMNTLIKNLPGDVRKVQTGKRYELDDNEFTIKFDDETLIVNREDKLTSLILGSINNYKKSIRQYSLHDFNSKDVYFNLFENNGLGQRHLNELDLMQEMFIDPITLEILKAMDEPTQWLGLLRRAAQLLLVDYSPKETDLSQMRLRGYERIAGAVYLEMVNSLRGYRGQTGNPNATVEMNPYAVWQTIHSDPSKVQVEESNPIKNINESEAVTFSGVGGRAKVGMVDRTRVYGKNDMGTISEATVDSGDVAINAYTTANPKLTSLRGLTKRWEGDETETSSLLSTGALLSPASDTDDPKRVNFITIQHGQGISSKGYSVTPLRTGYERIVPQRTSDLFATTAEQPGTVEKVTKQAITVKYEDGSTQIIELGRRFGKSAENVYPHSIVTNLNEGDKFKVGDAIAYNENFFTPDAMDPSTVLWKAGILCHTAIMEATDTYEDSSAISEKTAERLGTGITKVRDLFFDFDQTVRNMVNEGDEVDPESILCTIEDSVTADNDLFSDDTLDTLKLLSANTPRAKYAGKVERIEVLYYGDKEDMSESLRKIADASDKALAKKRKALGQKVVSGQVDDSIRIGKQVLELDSLVIKVYITKETGAGSGDKGVFGSQLKTVFARVMSGTNETESGEPIDAIFGYQSISNRIVLSPEVMGTTNTLLRVLSKRVAKIYKGEKV